MLCLSRSLYALVLLVLFPVFIVGSLFFSLFSRQRLKQFFARLGVGVPYLAGGTKKVWLHAASAGEIAGLSPLIGQLDPDITIFLTTTSLSGYQYGLKNIDQRVVLFFAPLDLKIFVAQFYRRVSPDIVVVTETELWPNLFLSAAKRKIPIFIINGRIYQRDLSRYRRFAWFFRPFLRLVSAIYVQDQEERERFAAIGADLDRLFVSGNSKFDKMSPCSSGYPGAWDRFAESSRVVVVGSIHKEEEKLLLPVLTEIASLFNDLKVIVAPRHLNRAGKLFSQARFLGFVPALWSSTWSGRPNFMVLDTMGELSQAYAIANVVLLGGSFSKKVQGHNPIEAAMLGKPLIIGPCMANFRMARDLLIKSGAAEECRDLATLVATLKELLRDTQSAQQRGKAGKLSLLQQQGAASRYAQLIQGVKTPWRD